MGEDVALWGGIFGMTQGLLQKFGPERVTDTPISEMGFIGAAAGAALEGCGPSPKSCCGFRRRVLRSDP